MSQITTPRKGSESGEQMRLSPHMKEAWRVGSLILVNRESRRLRRKEQTMSKQLSLFGNTVLYDNLARKKRNSKLRWEYAFQKWSNEQFMAGRSTEGICGYGSMCDWCEDNSYGRPCVRALNKMCREKGIEIDYESRDFEKIWRM